jgi:Arc/MetJ family transcription regulator
LKCASFDASYDAELEGQAMRTTVTLDDELLAKAQKLTGIEEKSALLREGLKLVIARESAKRLALLGGTEPQLKDIPRRRSRVE